jgi:hypothetical protein
VDAVLELERRSESTNALGAGAGNGSLDGLCWCWSFEAAVEAFPRIRLQKRRKPLDLPETLAGGLQARCGVGCRRSARREEKGRF